MVNIQPETNDRGRGVSEVQRDLSRSLMRCKQDMK